MINKYFKSLNTDGKKRWLNNNVTKENVFAIAEELGINVSDKSTKKQIIEENLDLIFEYESQKRSDSILDSMREVVISYEDHTYHADISTLKPCDNEVFCRNTFKFFNGKHKKVCPYCGKKWRPKNPKSDKKVVF